MKLTRSGSGLGRFILSPVAVIAMLALLTTTVALAAPQANHPPKDHPTASAHADESESPEAFDSDAPKASHSPGACNALNGNAPEVIAELVANWPTKHAKGGVPKDVPAGLQKVADRLASCPPLAGTPDENPAPQATPTPQPTASPVIVDDESTVLATGKKADKADKANNGRKP